MLGQRLLLVDDDKNVLITMGAILKRHGFQVTSASSVSEAIHEITKQTFDILVTDLNIGEPGDGFTVVSAMRRMQPDAAALIITGFPAFDNALQAIRQQVDDYLVKPIPPADLLATIERVRQTRSTHVPFATSRISAIVRANSHQIQTRWLAELKNYAKSIGRADLDDASLLNHLSTVIEYPLLSKRFLTGLTKTEPVPLLTRGRPPPHTDCCADSNNYRRHLFLMKALTCAKKFFIPFT